MEIYRKIVIKADANLFIPFLHARSLYNQLIGKAHILIGQKSNAIIPKSKARKKIFGDDCTRVSVHLVVCSSLG